MADEITITIDGREVTTTPGKMVVQAANDAGIYIPYLCYHPGMKPYGACRMCVVEIEGQRGTPASCTLPVRDGMVVNTKADEAVKVRNTTLDLLLSEHPHGCLTCHRIDLCGPQDICLRHVDVVDRCVTCPKNERCELKDTTRFHTQELVSPLTYQYRNLQVETRDPFYDRDYNLCIVCARCTRACDELRGDVAIGMTERAGQVLVGTVMGDSLLESGCEFCGACIDVCPVGALTETSYKWERPARVEQSVCAECPVGCTMTYEVNHWERVVRAVPELNAPANMGQACFKGKFGFEYVNDRRRIRKPLVRRNGELREASWDEAIAAAAEGLAPHRGPAFALMAGPRNTNEEFYAAQKFARAVMGSNSVDVASNDRPGIVEGLQDVFGYFAGTMSTWELADSAAVMVVSANLTEEQNVIGVPIKRAVRAGTQQLIVIDSREVELTRYASLWLRPYPGTDPVVLGGLLRCIVDAGLVDVDAVRERADGWDELVACLAPFTMDAVTAETGVPAASIEEAARLYAEAGPAALLFGGDGSIGGTRRTISRLAAALAIATGNVGRHGAGVLPLYQGANGQGAMDMGVWPAAMPGHNLIQESPEAREALGALWGAPVPLEGGSGNRHMFDRAREGALKAMLVLGDHVHYEDGTLGDVPAALDALDFLVATSAFSSAVTERADVVFPAEVWAEKTGTYTNIERRVQPLRKVARNKRVDSRSDLDVVCALAAAMGAQGFAWDGPPQVLVEIAQAVPEYGGISWERLLRERLDIVTTPTDEPQPTQVMYTGNVLTGLQWPCAPEGGEAPASAGTTEALFVDRFRHGKAQLQPVAWHSRPGADAQFPLMLAHGRVLLQPGRKPDVVVEGKRNRVQREERFVLNPADAAAANLNEGDAAAVTTADGAERHGVAALSDAVPAGVVSLTTLFGELAVEVDASDRPDPMNHIARLNPAPVRIAAVRPQ
ncbi:MAG: molybdopterin-dependent oxidoreductase [Chloroflexi bacterium]|nr:molybdopterin-dependent oxidoreductase [Chloroflexota bacterium]